MMFYQRFRIICFWLEGSHNSYKQNDGAEMNKCGGKKLFGEITKLIPDITEKTFNFV